MKIISWNVNGIRAVEKKGELESLIKKQKPDILFLQEIKAKQEQLSEYLTNHPEYYQYYHSAEKPGYSGVGVWVTKMLQNKEPLIINGLHSWEDTEGRIIRLDFKSYTLFGIYFPNGGKSDDAWKGKIEFYDRFLRHINQLKGDDKRKIIFCGDLNVAHNEIDLARPKENEGKIGFRKEEREWVDKLIQESWIDIFRSFHPNAVSYTWWDQKSRARERDIGWRIDYFFVDKLLLKKVKNISHMNEQMGSDHCPVVLAIDL